MTGLTFTESIVDQAALGWTVKHHLDIASGPLLTDREGLGEVVLKQRLRDALTRLNPDLPTEALEDAFAVSRKPKVPRWSRVPTPSMCMRLTASL
jgi:hypothetical protein